jgi:hypothetical protein
MRLESISSDKLDDVTGGLVLIPWYGQWKRVITDYPKNVPETTAWMKQILQTGVNNNVPPLARMYP